MKAMETVFLLLLFVFKDVMVASDVCSTRDYVGGSQLGDVIYYFVYCDIKVVNSLPQMLFFNITKAKSLDSSSCAFTSALVVISDAITSNTCPSSVDSSSEMQHVTASSTNNK